MSEPLSIQIANDKRRLAERLAQRDAIIRREIADGATRQATAEKWELSPPLITRICARAGPIAPPRKQPAAPTGHAQPSRRHKKRKK